MPPEFYDVELSRYLGISIEQLASMPAADRDVCEAIWRGRSSGLYNDYLRAVRDVPEKERTADVCAYHATKRLLMWHLGK